MFRFLSLPAHAMQIAMFVLAVWCMGALTAEAEVIRSFTVDVTPQTDGSFVVEETIAYDFEDASQRGIFRVIVNDHAQEASHWYKDRTFRIDLLAVSRDGESENYLIESKADPFRIRIGDPDVIITGLHFYTIRYRVYGALSYYEDSEATELYWNVTGNEWPITIETAKAVIRDPNDLFVDERACYKGTQGSTAECDSIEMSGDSVTFTATDLSSGTGLTIAQALDGERVAKAVVEETNYWMFAVAGAVLWLIGLVVYVYRYQTRYRLNRAHLVQFEPYKDFKPMFTGVLFDGRLDSHDISAGIVYLAEQGFIKIKKTERKIIWLFNTSDYEITLLREPTEVQSKFLIDVLALLFDAKHSFDFSNMPTGLKQLMGYKPKVELTHLDKPGNTIKLSDIKSDTSKQRTNRAILLRLKKSVTEDLVARKYFQTWSSSAFKRLFGFGVIAIVVLPIVIQFSVVVFALGLFCAVTLLIALLFTYRRRTTKGYEALWHLQGFKKFLSMTEKERYAFHNPPEKSPEVFMQYLPYAIAFGVEEKWAKVFADITIPNPDWYEDGSVGNFSATALTSDLGAFSSSFASSSGSSGSSGGGSSGGGSGGGGGGSW